MIAEAIVNIAATALCAICLPVWIVQSLAAHVEYAWHRHPDRVLSAAGCMALLVTVALVSRQTQLAWLLPLDRVFHRLYRLYRWITGAELAETAAYTRACCRRSAKVSEDVCNRTAEILRLRAESDKDAR